MSTAVKEAPTGQGAEGGEKKPRSKKKLVLILVVVLAVAGAGWFFFLKPTDNTPKPGVIMPLASTQINLAGGHYLKVGVALQLTDSAAKDIDGSKALDATIDLFSGLPVAEVSRAQSRHKLKDKLVKDLKERYDGDVMGVYFTEFVTQ